jgi:hypothetical protein
MAERPSLAKLRAAGERREALFRAPLTESFDLGRPLVPEAFTQLYHTSCYRHLDHAQRLRYNQLYGIRSNELFMRFERGFTCRVVTGLERQFRGRGEHTLADCLGLMLREEERHHAMFRDFNRRYLAGDYGQGAALFAPGSALDQPWLGWLLNRRLLQPVLVWLILVLEEFSTAFSRLLLQHGSTGGLGPLEVSYVGLHRLHLLDEARHVYLDTYLIEALLEQIGGTRERLGAWLFRRLFDELMAPKHSGTRVIRHLARELPGLSPDVEAMVSEVRALGRDPGMAMLLEDPTAMPISRGLLRHHPGFRWCNDLE